MYLKNIFIENNWPIERIEILEKDLFKSNGEPKSIVLVGKNWSWKTILLSNIVDAIHEFANDIFSDVLPNNWLGHSFYRIVWWSSQKSWSTYWFSFINFWLGSKKYEYLEKTWNIDHNTLKIKTKNLLTINQWYKNDENIKITTSTKKDKEIKNDLFNNTYAFFPVSRYETPHRLGSRQKEKRENIKINKRFSWELWKPIIIESGLEDNKSRILDLFLDSRDDLEIWEWWAVLLRNDYNTTKLLKQGRINIEIILSQILQKDVQLQLWLRNESGNRLKILDKESNKILIPSIGNLSWGQAILLNIFSSIIRLSDHWNINKSIKISEIEWIVMIDEIDLSLHIDLQKEILPNLMAIFPKIQFIITTHSPFFLLWLEEKNKENPNFEYQLIKLPEGILSNDIKWIEEVESAYDLFEENFRDFKEEFDKIKKKLSEYSNEDPLIITEWKTDWKHLKKALERFQNQWEYVDLNINFLEYEDEMWDNVLYNYCIAESKKEHSNKVICIFDADNDKVRKKVGEDQIKDRGKNVYSFCIPKPSSRSFDEVCIEHYYSDIEIKTLDTAQRRLFLWSDFSEKCGACIDENDNRIKKKDKVWKNIIIDNMVYASTDISWDTNIALSKTSFAQNVFNATPWFDNFNIDNFRLIFDKLKSIVIPNTTQETEPLESQ